MSHCRNARGDSGAHQSLRGEDLRRKLLPSNLSDLRFLVAQVPFDIDNSEMCGLPTCLWPCNFNASRSDIQLLAFVPFYRKAFSGQGPYSTHIRRNRNAGELLSSRISSQPVKPHKHTWDAPKVPHWLNSSCPHHCPAW